MMAHGGQVWQGGDPDKWLDFSANLRPEGPPDWVIDALNEAIDDARYYPDVAMAREVSGLAEYLKLPKECVLPTAGGMAAIELAIRALGGDVRTAPPTFLEYQAAARRGDDAGTGFVRVLCNPNNPTGAALSRDEVLAVLAQTEAQGGKLIVDEAFVFCCPERSVANMVVHHPALIVVGSLTKSLCIPGVRLGYVCAYPDVMQGLTDKQPPWTLNCLAVHVLRALAGHADVLEADACFNRQRRARFVQRLGELGLRVYPSEANFVLVDMRQPAEPIAAALKERGILVRECMDFVGIDDGQHLRLAVKTNEQNAWLCAALEALL